MHLTFSAASVSPTKLGAGRITLECIESILNKYLGALFKEFLQSA